MDIWIICRTKLKWKRQTFFLREQDVQIVPAAYQPTQFGIEHKLGTGIAIAIALPYLGAPPKEEKSAKVARGPPPLHTISFAPIHKGKHWLNSNVFPNSQNIFPP